MFSIIIPTYNRFYDLLNTLKLLNNQEFKDFDVIVIDDFSSDFYDIKAIEEVAEYPIIYHKLQKNSGPSEARNIGVSLSSKEWIVFLDDDDEFLPEKLLKINEKVNGADFIYHKAKIKMVNEKVEYITSQKNISLIDDLFHSLLKINYIGGAPNFAIKKNLFVDLGGFDCNLGAIEDYELILRISKMSNVKITFINEILTICNYVTKRESVSKNVKHTSMAIDWISNKYALNDNENKIISSNKWLMLAHAELMSLHRASAIYYFKHSLLNGSFRSFIIASFVLISPSLVIKMRSVV